MRVSLRCEVHMLAGAQVEHEISEAAQADEDSELLHCDVCDHNEAEDEFWADMALMEDRQ